MKTKVSVVIPNWNGERYLRNCLDSLQKQTMSCRVIVVDNGSVDNSIELISKHYPKVKLITLDKNHGFAGGVNRGIEYAMNNGDDFVALLNNDAVANPDWLERLLTAAEQYPRAGIITGKFMHINGKQIDSTGDTYSVWGIGFPRGRGEIDAGQYNQEQFVFGATGGASLYRVKMLKTIGLFDEDFFAYLEDVDISFRAQLAGWKVLYTPLAIAKHHIGGTSRKHRGLQRYHSTKNLYLLYTKNMPLFLFFLCLPFFAVGQLRTFIACVFHGGSLGIFLRAKWRTIVLLPSTLKKRRRIQRNRKVSIKYILSMLSWRLPFILKRPI